LKILLHSCCAPCLIGPFHSLRERGHEVTAYFYNPNIMPYREFRRRLTAFRDYTKLESIPVIIDENYKLEYMLRRYLERGEIPRCRICYEERLGHTGKIALEKGFDAFATTLAVSPYQDHELIRTAGREASEHFLYEDWRPLFTENHEKAKKLGIYMQGYCGCIFSEEERYRPSVRKKIQKERIG